MMMVMGKGDLTLCFGCRDMKIDGYKDENQDIVRFSADGITHL
jgi:hypothetical protein